MYSGVVMADVAGIGVWDETWIGSLVKTKVTKATDRIAKLLEFILVFSNLILPKMLVDR